MNVMPSKKPSTTANSNAIEASKTTENLTPAASYSGNLGLLTLCVGE
jgi:hypothetical protein